MSRNDALRMVKRRAKEAVLPSNICNHTFRATGITAYLENGGTIEKAQAIAAHESPRSYRLFVTHGSSCCSMVRMVVGMAGASGNGDTATTVH
jgi:integrase